jgi:hypothetical protein
MKFLRRIDPCLLELLGLAISAFALGLAVGRLGK